MAVVAAAAGMRPTGVAAATRGMWPAGVAETYGAAGDEGEAEVGARPVGTEEGVGGGGGVPRHRAATGSPPVSAPAHVVGTGPAVVARGDWRRGRGRSWGRGRRDPVGGWQRQPEEYP